MVIDVAGQMTENVHSVDGQGTAAVRLDYLKLNLGMNVDGQPSAKIAPVQQLLQQANLLGGDLRLDRQGNVLLNRLDLSKVPVGARGTFTNFGEQLQQSLEALSVPLPGGIVNPGQAWAAQRSLPVDAGGKYDVGIMDMTYTYLGVRSRSGRDEAVISLGGTVRARQGVKQYIKGRTSGTAVVDVASGLVTAAMASIEVDLDMIVDGTPARADGVLELKLQRAVPGGK
jgi:hypothetical protein